MFGDDIVVETRLSPPRLPRHWLRRPRLDQLLAGAAEYPLTIVSASAGYGKSSALAAFAARGGWPVIWYSLDEAVADPLVFLLHLVHACRKIAPQSGARAIALLEQHSQGTQFWGQALDTLVNDLARMLDDETILVLDDQHAADDTPLTGALIERLIERAPPQLHVLLASRHWPSLGCLPIRQARGELLAIGEYLGDYLYADWARAERERLTGRHLEAATQLAELRIARGQPADAIELCESILARDPCWEDAYRLLIHAHAQQGHRRQALATYERCVRALRTQFDMAPLLETTQAYEQVRRELGDG
jgi:hypothetical protein